MLKFIAFVSMLFWASNALAAMSDQQRAYVESNLTSIFYHELGHAVIHLKDVPILAQEEDVADAFSILLIDALNEEDDAQSIAVDSAFGYINDPEGKDEVAH